MMNSTDEKQQKISALIHEFKISNEFIEKIEIFKETITDYSLSEIFIEFLKYEKLKISFNKIFFIYHEEKNFWTVDVNKIGINRLIDKFSGLIKKYFKIFLD